MKDEEIVEWLENNGCEDSVFLRDYNYYSAIVGVDQDNRIIYSYELMIDYLVKEQDMTMIEAIEWIDVNTLRVLECVPLSIRPIVLFPLI